MTVLVGPNAVGKTSIIEAIQLLTALSTLRRSSAEEMIRFGEDAARVEVRVGDGSRQLDIAAILSGRSRKYTLNGKPKRASDLRGTVPAVTFSPDDLELAKGSNSTRRRALDQLGVQLNANYLQLVHDFDKIHRHKNKLLKDDVPKELLEAVDETFARVSSQLTNYRCRMFERLLPHMQRMYSQIVGKSAANISASENTSAEETTILGTTEQLSGIYRASCECGDENENTEAPGRTAETDNPADRASQSGVIVAPCDIGPDRLLDAIAARRQEESIRSRALEGAHLDRIDFMISGRSAQKFASQGQQRSLVLAWKLAEVELVKEMLGQPPILLLDDVMSELDESRRAALMQHLSHGLQVFITTTNAEHFTEEMLAEADIIQLPLE